MTWQLPMVVEHIAAPPLKSQGIKTKLVRFIAMNVRWDAASDGRWVEPFVGTGCVALNLAPPRALLTDLNPHVVRLLTDIQTGSLTPSGVRSALSREGKALAQRGKEHYYEVRERFNAIPSSIDFLFLNRSCFNGVVRFNGSGRFNTPFGHKPQRFDARFLTRVENQISWAVGQMRNKDWDIRCADWRDCLGQMSSSDFVYLDPPYIGRHADYFNQWREEDAATLATRTQALPCGYALSMWLENRFRVNSHISTAWPAHIVRRASHFYHVGSTESLRNEMIEALVVRPGYEAGEDQVYQTKRPPEQAKQTKQPSLFDDE